MKTLSTFEIQVFNSKGTVTFLTTEQGGISTLVLNSLPLKKYQNTIKGHMSKYLIWRLCDKVLSFMKRKCSGFPIINALVPAKPLLIPNVRISWCNSRDRAAQTLSYNLIQCIFTENNYTKNTRTPSGNIFSCHQ